jgi:hypothetical protein
MEARAFGGMPQPWDHDARANAGRIRPAGNILGSRPVLRAFTARKLRVRCIDLGEDLRLGEIRMPSL